MFHRRPIGSLARFSVTLLALFAVAPWLPARGQGVWGIEESEFRRRVLHGDYAFLKHLNYDDLKLSEVQALGDGASYYTGLIFQKLDMPEEAARLLALAARESPSPWSDRAGNALIVHLRETEAYRQLEKRAAELLARGRDDVTAAAGYLEALYEQDKFPELLRALETEVPREIHERADALLWRGVSVHKTGGSGWRETFDSLFFDHPANVYQSRVYLYIAARSELKSEYSEAEMALFRAKHFLSEGKAAEAFSAFQRAVDLLRKSDQPAAKARQLISYWTVRDIGVAALGANRFTDGTGLLTAVAEVGTDSLSRVIDEYRGRLALARESYADARRWLGAALAAAPSEGERSRMLRYYLRALIGASPTEAALAIGGYLSGSDAPARYDTLLEDLSAELVSRRQWDALHSAYRGIEALDLPESVAQYAVVLAEAARHGLYELPQGSSREALLETALRRSSPYYAFLASVLLDREPASLLPSSGADDSYTPGTEVERYISGYFDFGLVDRGYEALRSNRQKLSEKALMHYAKRLAERGDIPNSMRVADSLFRDDDQRISTELLQRRYPHAFYRQITAVTDDYDLPRWVFFGLVREESYFEPGVGSVAGAVGLTQLMPATAEEMAHRLALEEPDIADPATNLRIGGYYLDRLRGRFSDLTPALLAYNAGPTRVRRWSAEFGDLPGLLFPEAVPFAETRNYLRKVLVSAVYYGYLYGDTSVSDSVELFFPDITPTGER